MPGTRSSARLASTKGKETKRGGDEAVDDPKLDEASARADSEYDESEDEEPQPRPPPRKRQKVAKAPTRKKQVRGKQGSLAGLVNVPIDIFTEIASHFLPVDVISLSRANKFFRSLLMSKSSSHIWHTAMRNVRGLPPCPPDLSEPHYLSLLFSKHCTMCGQVVRCRLDEVLRVRLCVSCRHEHLITLDNVPWELRSLVHHSSKVVPSKRRWGADADYALKEEVHEIERQHQEIKNGGDQVAMIAWETDRRIAISRRVLEATEIQMFFDTIDNDREQELREMKNARRREIENRLAKLGWDKKDMQFTYTFHARREWYSLVEQARPLTERIWSNLQPKLIPILQANRESRLQKEKSERQSARRLRLVHLLNEIKKNQAPILDITVRAPAGPPKSPSPDGSGSVSQVASSSGGDAEAQSSNDIPTETSSNTSQATLVSGNTDGATKSPSHTTFHGMFPDIVDALEWPMVKSLCETDTSVGEMEQNFGECRNEIDAAIVDWKAATHARLAEMLRQDQEIQGELLVPHRIVLSNDSDPFANLSDDMKLLLRADSLFTCITPQRNGLKKLVYSYDVAASQFGYRLSFKDGIMSKPYKPPLDFSLIRVCDEARPVARALLAYMGLENACAAELKSAGRVYACGRCHDSGLKTWEELVSHFVEAKEVFERTLEHADQLDARRVMYRDVHNPEAFPDRPLVKYTSEPNAVHITRACIICSSEPIKHVVRGTEAKIIEHLKDVHDITEPKLGTHYSNSSYPYPFGFDPPFDFGIDAGIFFTPFDDSDSDMDPFWDGDFW